MNLQEFCTKNWYTLLDYIPLNWNRYGDWIPSVTTILSLLYDKGFEFVKRNHAEAVAQACIRGTDIHDKAESFFDNGWEINHQILKFHVLYNIHIVWKEVKVVKDIQGTIDLIALMLDDDVPKNFDYKSSKNKSAKYRLQLAGYKYLNGLDGALLYLDKKKFILDQFDTDEYLPAFIELKDYFLTLLQQWRLQ